MWRVRGKRRRVCIRESRRTGLGRLVGVRDGGRLRIPWPVLGGCAVRIVNEVKRVVVCDVTSKLLDRIEWE